MGFHMSLSEQWKKKIPRKQASQIGCGHSAPIANRANGLKTTTLAHIEDSSYVK